MTWIGRLGFVAIACAVSSLAAAAIGGGAVGDDPTLSACVEQGNAELHQLSAGQKCGSLGITGQVISWDQRGGLTDAQADLLETKLRRQRASVRRLMRISHGLQNLLLKRQLRDEGRRITLLSEIMKTKHGTVANLISNVR